MLRSSLNNVSSDVFFQEAIKILKQDSEGIGQFNSFTTPTDSTLHTVSFPDRCKKVEAAVNFKSFLEQATLYINGLSNLEIIEHAKSARELLVTVIECLNKSFDDLMANIFPDSKIAWRVNEAKAPGVPDLKMRAILFGSMQALICDIHFLIKTMMQALIKQIFWQEIEALQLFFSLNEKEMLKNLMQSEEAFSSSYPVISFCFICIVEFASSRGLAPVAKIELFHAFLREEYQENDLIKYGLPAKLDYSSHNFSTQFPLQNYYYYELGRTRLFKAECKVIDGASGLDSSYVLGLYHGLNQNKPNLSNLTKSLKLTPDNFFIIKQKLLSLMQLVMHKLQLSQAVFEQLRPQYNFSDLIKYVDHHMPADIGQSWINMMSLIGQFNEKKLNIQEEKGVCNFKLGCFSFSD